MLCINNSCYKYIYYLSYFHFIHILYGYYKEQYLCAFFDTIVMITSLNYWRLPLLNSKRRIIDILCSVLNVIYHIYLATYINDLLIYFFIFFPIIVWFLEFSIKDDCIFNCYLITFMHCILHIFFSIAVMLIYLKIK